MVGGAAAEIVHLYEKASSAADAAVDGEGIVTEKESRAVDALHALQKVPISTALLVETQVAKKVRRLAKHQSGKIREAAQALVDTWKKSVAAEGSAKPKAAEEPSDRPDAAQPSAAPAAEAAKPDTARPAADGTATGGGEAGEPPSPSGVGSEGGASRQVSKEEVEAAMAGLAGTGDALRDKLRANIVEALMMAQVDAKTRACDTVSVGVAVEQQLFEQFVKGRDTSVYKAKYRSIHFNLKDKNNPDLRNRVLTGGVSPARLMTMSAEEMASDEKKYEIKMIRDKAMFEADRSMKNVASTDQFKCGRCKQRKCTYFQMQTRSADEPMTTFVTCTVCQNRWKFC